jgi:hypothetical protein
MADSLPKKSNDLSDNEEPSSTASSSRSPSPNTKTSQKSTGVSHLLQTDTIPSRPTEAPPPVPENVEPIYELRTVGIEREEGGMQMPDYMFVSSDTQPHLVYNFLDSITEVSYFRFNMPEKELKYKERSRLSPGSRKHFSAGHRCLAHAVTLMREWFFVWSFAFCPNAKVVVDHDHKKSFQMSFFIFLGRQRRIKKPIKLR